MFGKKPLAAVLSITFLDKAGTWVQRLPQFQSMVPQTMLGTMRREKQLGRDTFWTDFPTDYTRCVTKGEESRMTPRVWATSRMKLPSTNMGEMKEERVWRASGVQIQTGYV